MILFFIYVKVVHVVRGCVASRTRFQLSVPDGHCCRDKNVAAGFDTVPRPQRGIDQEYHRSVWWLYRFHSMTRLDCSRQGLIVLPNGLLKDSHLKHFVDGFPTSAVFASFWKSDPAVVL